METIIMALPVFALLVLAEVLYTRWQGHNAYALKDFGGSMSQLGINSLVRLAIGGALISLHFFLYQFRVFEVPNTVWGWVLTFVVIDFVFYWYHRAQHRVRFMWCAHVVHHSSEHMNLGTALRQSPTGPFTRALFYWPLPLLGFHPLMVAGAGAVAMIYAFFTHTEVVKKLWAPLEWWTVYNGLVAYVLMGLLFVAEYVPRKLRFGRWGDGPVDRLLLRLWPGAKDAAEEASTP